MTTRQFALLTLFASANNGWSQTFINAGFEAPAMGGGSWQYSPTDPQIGWSGPNVNFVAHWGIANGNSPWGDGPHSGSQYGFIQQQGYISQTLSGFNIGTQYRLSFWMATRRQTPTNPITIEIDGNQLVTYAPTTAMWVLYSADFTATSGSHTISLNGEVGLPPNDQSSLVDDFSIHAVPEPAGLAVLGLGLVAVLRRRCRHGT